MKDIKGSKILVTGGAGFIGSHLVDSLLRQNALVYVLDNFNEFYNPQDKRENVKEHIKQPGYTLIEGDLRNDEILEQVFRHGTFDVVVHLAAMAGVRPSLSQPAYYMDVNVNGTQKLVGHVVQTANKTRFVFGSSSSVYGTRSGESFVETDRVDQPLSPYAASKAAGELLCYTAHSSSGLNVICLRFFTVFGPRQRPDLAIHKFCQLIDNGEPIEVYGTGKSKRDYTYVADIVQGIEKDSTGNLSGFEIINLGRSEPVILMDMIHCLEKHLGKKANIIHKSDQVGDMPYTYADIRKARSLLGYNPNTSFDKGIEEFVRWYKSAKTYAPTKVL
jgi:UDP-glucuronate 4-epimerase